MTYSIAAYDPAARRWGVAVQSCVFAVGIRVPAVREGAGAIAVQAGSPSWYRSPGLDLVGRGMAAAEVVAALAALPGPDTGQFTVVDAAGRAGAHTGGACITAAGHCVADSAVTAANLVVRQGMWEEMMAAYQSSGGPFEARLIAALAAGEAAGGDIRGRQSAALLVSAGTRGGDRLFETDLRVDDAGDPVTELARLWNVKSAHDELRRALPDGKAGDWEAAADRLAGASAAAPGDPLVTVWTGLALGLAGRTAEAQHHLLAARRRNPRLTDYLAREPLLARPQDRQILTRLLSGAAGPQAGESGPA